MDKLREIQVQELFGVARGSHKNFILINHIWAELGVDFKNIIVIEAIYDTDLLSFIDLMILLEIEVQYLNEY